MRRLTDRFGAPFDAVLVVGTATEDGKTLRSGQELVPLLAHTIHTYTSAGIGIEAGGMMNNLFTLVRSTTDDGELKMLGSPGFVRAEFDAPTVVRRYLAPALAAPLLSKWALVNNEVEASNAEADVADTTHMRSEYELLAHAQVSDEGAFVFITFDDFAAQRFHGRRIGAKEFPSELLEAEGAYRGDLIERLALAEDRLRGDAEAYASSLVQRARGLLNAYGPSAGVSVLGLGIARLDGIKAAVSAQRDELAAEIEILEAAVAEGFTSVDAAAARAGVFRSVKKQVAALLGALNQSFGLRRPFELAELVIGVTGDARRILADALSNFNVLITVMNAEADALQSAASAFETTEPTALEELIRRPLHDAGDLRALYELGTACPSGTVSDQLEQEVRLRVGALDEWLGRDQAEVREFAIDATAPTFASVHSMTADAFLGWKCRRAGVPSALALRALVARSPLLCRYDRTRLPEDDSAYENSFALIGVPDEGASTFFGTDEGVLVTTADPIHISILRLTFGMPASSLWGFERMRRAHAAQVRNGDDRRGIYPGLRDPSGHSHRRGASPRRRRRS